MTSGQVEIDWGDGNSETVEDGADNISHDYGGTTGSKTITMKFTEGFNDVTTFDIDGQNAAGDIAIFKDMRSLVYLKIGNTSLSGSLRSLINCTLIRQFAGHNSPISGDLAYISYFHPSSLGFVYLYGSSVSEYTGATFPSDGTLESVGILLMNLTDLDYSEISQLIIDLDDCGATDGDLRVDGCNGGTMTYADLTSEGQAAHDNLTGKGWSIQMDT
jgi:hypothetical protein